jgi:glycosyltransferase involved in cell wall biosynthesis
MIVLPFHNRPNYLAITLATLREAIVSNELMGMGPSVITFDDASTEPYPNILDLEIDTKVIIKEHVKNEGEPLTSYRASSFIIDHVFNNYSDNVVVVIDSDCIVHPKAIHEIHALLKEFPDMGFGSVYNSCNHKGLKDYKDKYLKKEHIGGLGSVIRKEAWEWHKCQPSIEDAMGRDDVAWGWDWNLCKTLNMPESKWNIYTTINSYVEHFGQTGTHSGPYCKIDKAIRFLD